MKICWLVGWLFLLAGYSYGQFRAVSGQSFAVNGSSSESSYLMGNQKPTQSGGWRSDPQAYYHYSSPRQTISPVMSNGSSYWLGSTTVQSFNNGKFGTIYYYDIMGNMLYSRTFIDIAGKNKRGLKLLLPTLNQRMFMQR